MTDNGLATFYRRYNACCNEHRFDDLGDFVAPDVTINGTDRGLETYAENLRSVVRAFPDFRWELRHVLTEPPWIAVHLADTGTHHPSGRAVGTPEFAFYRIADGRIAEVWGMPFGDLLALQLR